MKKIFLILFLMMSGLVFSEILPPSGTTLPEGIATEETLQGISDKLDDRTVYDTQLQHFKFEGDDLKVKVNNSTAIPVSGTVTANPTSYSYTPHFDDKTLSDTTVWYAYTIPENTIEISIKARTGYDYKVSAEYNGAHYETIWAGDRFFIQQVRDTTITGTLYFNSPTKAGLVLEVRYLTK